MTRFTKLFRTASPTRKHGVMRKLAIGIIGGTVVLLGVVMIVLPGPAVLVIPAGVAILATEFYWARRYLARGRGILARWKEGRLAGLSWGAALKHSVSRRSQRKPAVLH